MSKIAKDLVAWYKIHQRPLPFRENKDPYRVWISEIMAQQTQIDTLLPYYHRWMKEFPTLKALSFADEENLLKAWEGLGYYSRVRNIQRCAKEIIENHQGIFPTQLFDIQNLSGIGPYTASAIASICFETKTAAIDGNVKRVMSRLFRYDESSLKKVFIEKITQTIETWMNDVSPNELTQALMELGALVCTKQAKCSECPISIHCEAYKTQEVHLYPSVKKKTAKKSENLDVVYLINDHQELALTLTHQDALMKGYYRLPLISQCTLYLDSLKKDTELIHVFTHKIWNVSFYTASTTQTQDDFIWVALDQVKTLPLITLHRNYLESKSL